MGQTVTDDFWGLHKKMNWAFPLKKTHVLNTLTGTYDDSKP